MRISGPGEGAAVSAARSAGPDRGARCTAVSLLALLLLALVPGCGGGGGGGSTTASLTVSLAPVAASGVRAAAAGTPLPGVPAEVTAIEVSVRDGAGTRLATGDLVASGGTLTLTVPTGVALALDGTARAGAETLFHGTTPVAPLNPGERRHLALTLADAVTLALTAPASAPTGTPVAVAADLSGLHDASLRWYVNGIEGGDATVGTIDADGRYTPPQLPASAEQMAVTIRCEPVVAPSFAREATVTVTRGTTTSTCHDADGDGYGTPGDATCIHGAAPDCDDTDAAVHPGAGDATCDGVDNDCDGTVDEGCDHPPTARLTATPATGEAPLTVAFDGATSSDAEGAIAAYAWDFGDGASATGASASHTYGAAGSFTATLTVTDGGGATASATTTITVSAATAVQVTIAPAAPRVLTGETISLSAAVSGSASSAVTWSVDGVAGGSAASGTITGTGLYTAPATPRVVTVSAASAADPSATASVTLTVVDPAGAGLWAAYSNGTGVVEGTIVHGDNHDCDTATGGNMYQGVCTPVSASPVDWAWGSGFDVTWTGSVIPPVTGSYSFRSGGWVDGIVRVEVGGALIADIDTPGGGYAGSVDLVAGQAAPVTLTFRPNGGTNNMRFFWRLPGSTAVDPVARAYLVPGGSMPVAVSVAPASATLAPGGVQPFAASVVGTTDTAVTWSTEASTCSDPGAVDTGGTYTAGHPTTTCTETVRATSAADPTRSGTATVTVVVNQPPVISLLGPDPAVVLVGGSYVDAGATASDDLDGDLTGAITTTSTVDTAVAGEYTVTYEVSDSGGLAATPVVRTVRVVAAGSPPVISSPVGPHLIGVVKGGSTHFPAVARDVDAGDVLTFDIATPAAHGVAAVAADGTVTYQPAASFLGSDAFEVRVTDLAGGSDLLHVDAVVVEPPGYTLAGTTAGEGLGSVVAVAGDVDGDGADDLIVGLPDAGVARIYSGRDGSLVRTLTGVGGESFGYAVDGAGDVNGDGRADVIVGARTATIGGVSHSGGAYVYSGADGALLYTLGGQLANDYAGESVAGGGDLDGDGVPDFALGASNSFTWIVQWFSSTQGAVYFFSGADGSLLYTRRGRGDYVTGFGRTVALAGDVDGNGTSEVAIGTRTTKTDYGEVFSVNPPSVRLHLRGSNVGTWSSANATVAGAGDVDGDGRPDILLGSVDGGGHVRLYSGSDASLLYTFSTPSTGQGPAVAGAGDVDGDGHPDLLVGAPGQAAGSLAGAGIVSLYSGASGALLTTLQPTATGDALGTAIAAGDFNGDGTPDLALGAPRADSGGLVNNGAIHVLFSPLADSDGDGWSDVGEGLATTDPASLDSDADGIADGVELLLQRTNPLRADTDGDGTADGDEVRFGLDPLDPDLPRSLATALTTDFEADDGGLRGTGGWAWSAPPRIAASSGTKAWVDPAASAYGGYLYLPVVRVADATAPVVSFRYWVDGGDGSDTAYLEVTTDNLHWSLLPASGQSCCDSSDSFDAWYGHTEFWGTTVADLSPYAGQVIGLRVVTDEAPEVYVDDLYLGDDVDVDGDTLDFTAEAAIDANPWAADTDGDTLTDDQEQALGTHPAKSDTDGDGLADPVESNSGTFVDAGDTGTDPTNRDTDGDGLVDGGEVELTSSPVSADTDGDGVDDREELWTGSDLHDPASQPRRATFATTPAYTIGGLPQDMAAVDLDGDGSLDLVVTRDNAWTSDSVAVLLGDGAGGLGAPTEYTVGSGPRGIAAADLDGDGKVDLVVANNQSATLSILLGDGAGGVLPATTVSVAANPSRVVAADFNGDNKPDLAVTHWVYNGGSLSVLLNDGSGGFPTPVSYTVENGPSPLATADLDGDGDIDLVVGNTSSRSLSILLNNGTGTFATATTLGPATYGPNGLAVADLDGDGNPDVAVAHSNGVTLYPGNGDGTFGTTVDLLTGSSTADLVVGDADGDGDLDLALLHQTSHALSLLLSDGAGGWSGGPAYLVGDMASHLLAADLDGDTDLDLVALNENDRTASLLLGDGTGQFAGTRLLVPGSNTGAVTVADLNGDTHPDLALSRGQLFLGDGTGGFTRTADSPLDGDIVAAADLDGDTAVDLVGSTPTGGNNLTVALNDGSAAFTSAAADLGAQPARAAIAADFDGDGSPDVAAAHYTSPYGALLLGDGSGGLGAPLPLPPLTTLPEDLTTDDLDGDGLLDLVTPRELLLGDGLGGFSTTLSFGLGSSADAVAIVDLDQDGFPDVGVVNRGWGAGTVSLLRNDGSGGLALLGDYPAGDRPDGVAAADMNGDGRPDLVVVNNGAATVSVLGVDFPVGAEPTSVAVADVNHDGKPDVITSGTRGITLLINTTP